MATLASALHSHAHIPLHSNGSNNNGPTNDGASGSNNNSTMASTGVATTTPAPTMGAVLKSTGASVPIPQQPSTTTMISPSTSTAPSTTAVRSHGTVSATMAASTSSAPPLATSTANTTNSNVATSSFKSSKSATGMTSVYVKKGAHNNRNGNSGNHHQTKQGVTTAAVAKSQQQPQAPVINTVPSVSTSNDINGSNLLNTAAAIPWSNFAFPLFPIGFDQGALAIPLGQPVMPIVPPGEQHQHMITVPAVVNETHAVTQGNMAATTANNTTTATTTTTNITNHSTGTGTSNKRDSASTVVHHLGASSPLSRTVDNGQSRPSSTATASRKGAFFDFVEDSKENVH